MAYTQVCRFLDNEDASSVRYKTFNEYVNDRYPSFSTCLYSPPGFSLQHLVKNVIKEEIGISDIEFNHLLTGFVTTNDNLRNEALLGNISQSDYDPFLLKLEDFMLAYTFERQRNGLDDATDLQENANESSPFQLSYTDPDKVCFTRRSKDETGLIRIRDWLSLDWKNLRKAKVLLQIYVHHPGQLTRSIGKPDLEINPTKLSNDTSRITLRINGVSVLRKRADAKIPCDDNLEDDDNRFKEEVIRMVGCIPIYWKSFTLAHGSFNFCQRSSEMLETFDAIKRTEKTMARYKKPCNYMEASVAITQQPRITERVDNIVFVELYYMKNLYQEITNFRDFGFESFWSSVGGFVGIFVGYSLLQLPEIFGGLALWILKQNVIMNISNFTTGRG